MVRLNRNFFPSGQTVQLIQASFPSPGAEPWAGSGGQLMRPGTDELISNANFFLAGLPSNIPFYSSVTVVGINVDLEEVLIFGSRHAPTRFYLGVVPVDGLTLPGLVNSASLLLGPGETVDEFNARIAQVADRLAKRPLLAASMESGRGGFGAIFAQVYLSSGEVYSISSGPLKIEESTLAEAPGGVKAQQKLLIQAEEPMPEGGLFFYGAAAERQAGLCEWSYLVEALEFHRNNGSTYPCASSYGPNTFVATDNMGSGIVYGQPVHLSASVPTPPGTFKFEFSHTHTGRDGGGIEGYGAPVSALVLSQTLVFLGYINADFKALYGWQMGLIEQPY